MPSLKQGLFSKKKSSFGSKKSNLSKRNIKIFSALLILISVFLFVALISYSYEDESNIQMNFSEVIGLATGDDIAQIKAETTNNWLGLFGAFISYYLYNHTFGYVMILLPFILFYTGWELLKNGSINEYVIKYGIYFLLGCIAFSGFMGTIFDLEWISPFPREWSGSIGLYLSYLTSSLIGSFGAFLLFLAGLTAVIIFAFNIDTDKLIKNTTSTIEGSIGKFKENQTKKKNSVKTKVKSKSKKKEPEKNKTKDGYIAKLANEEERVVITKDVDFLESFIVKSEPKKLVIVKTGNIVNRQLLKLFEENLEVLQEMISRSNLVEISRTEIAEHR